MQPQNTAFATLAAISNVCKAFAQAQIVKLARTVLSASSLHPCKEIDFIAEGNTALPSIDVMKQSASTASSKYLPEPANIHYKDVTRSIAFSNKAMP